MACLLSYTAIKARLTGEVKKGSESGIKTRVIPRAEITQIGSTKMVRRRTYHVNRKQVMEYYGTIST